MEIYVFLYVIHSVCLREKKKTHKKIKAFDI